MVLITLELHNAVWQLEVTVENSQFIKEKWYSTNMQDTHTLRYYIKNNLMQTFLFCGRFSDVHFNSSYQWVNIFT